MSTIDGLRNINHHGILDNLLALQDSWGEKLAVSSDNDPLLALAPKIFLENYTEKNLAIEIPFWIKRNIYFFTEAEEKEKIAQIYQIFSKNFPAHTKGVALLAEQIALLDEIAQHTVTYEEMIRFYPEADTVISQRAAAEKEIILLSSLLKCDDWKQIIQIYAKNIDHLAYDGLRAFRDGKIDYYEFTTLVLFWSLANQLPDGCTSIRVMNLSEIPIEALKKMMERSKISIEDIFYRMNGAECFLELMKRRHPNSGNVFFVFDKGNPKKGEQSIIDVIVNIAQMNTFMNIEIDGVSHRMLPSLQMMQTWLHALQTCHHGDTVWMSPVLGASPAEEIKECGMTNKRVFACAFPGKLLPRIADLRLVEFDLDFSMHDFYHACIVSGLRLSTRQEFIGLGTLIEQLAGQINNHRLRQYITCFAFRVFDMEHTIFRDPVHPPPVPLSAADYIFENLSDGGKFIAAIHECMISALTESVSENLGNAEDDAEVNSRNRIPDVVLSDPELKMCWKELDLYLQTVPFMQLLASRLTQMKFCEKHGMTPKNLEMCKLICKSATMRFLENHVRVLEKILFDASEDSDDEVSLDRAKKTWMKRHFILLIPKALPNLLSI